MKRSNRKELWTVLSLWLTWERNCYLMSHFLRSLNSSPSISKTCVPISFIFSRRTLGGVVGRVAQHNGLLKALLSDRRHWEIQTPIAQKRCGSRKRLGLVLNRDWWRVPAGLKAPPASQLLPSVVIRRCGRAWSSSVLGGARNAVVHVKNISHI